MKNKIKGLLALVLSVLIGQVWAADATLDTDVSKAIRQALDVSDGKSVSVAMRLSFKEAAASLSTDATFASLTVHTIGNGSDIKNQGNGAHLHAYSANHGIGGNVGNGGGGTWFNNRAPVGTGSHVVVFVVSPEGSDAGKVTLTSYADGEVLKRDNQSTFANWVPTDGKVYFNTAKNDTLWTYESVTYFEKALTQEEVRNISQFMGRGETISLNFASGKTNGSVADGTASGLVSVKGWMNLAGESGSGEKVTICDGESLISEFPVTYSFESATTWSWDAGTANNCNYINGYLDDGTHNGVNGPTINISNIPFSKYSLIVYTATDTGNGAFRPVSINGTSYKGSSVLTSVGYAVASTDNWGRSQTTSAVYGTNALRVDGLSGDLTIQGGGKSGNNRGCIAAIQIVNAGVIFDANGQQTIDWSENEAPKTSELPELLKYNVELTLSDGATLVVDDIDAIKDLHKIKIKSSGTVTINVTDVEVDSSELDLLFNTEDVTGGVKITYAYTETLGYKKDNVTYPLIFRGTTDANLATLSNWYIGTRTLEEITYWIPYIGNTPAIPNGNLSDALLVDGGLIGNEITVDEETGYKVVNAPTLEGWNFNLAAANGVHVKISALNKLQGGCVIRVDGTSKITVASKGYGNNDVNNSYYIEAENGLVFTGMPMPGGTSYFGLNGSISTRTFANKQTIGGVKLDFGEVSECRKIVSRKLIGFEDSGETTFSVANNAVTTSMEGVELEYAEDLQKVGDYNFEQKEDGYYVNYVAYAPAAKIGDEEYATLGAAVTAAANGAIITVLDDCTADTAIVIADKALTIDLNGKTVKSTGNDGNGVFWVKNDGVLTLEDSSEAKTGTVDGNGTSEYKMAIWADGGSVVINGGNYINVNNGPDDQYDLIYVKHGGSIEINGGTFVCQTPRWTLNSHNTEKGTFVVKGGKFNYFNPTSVDTDDNVTTWCAKGYIATQGEDGYWTVVSNNVAKIGDEEFETLQAALTAAGTTADVEVTLIKNTTENITIPAGFNGTIDLGGKTLTGNVQATGEDSKKIVSTIENGSIVVQESKDAVIVNTNSVITLAVNVTGNLRHIIRVNAGGNCIINSGTYTLIKDGDGVNILYLAGAGAQMTVKGGTFIGQAGLKGSDIYAVQMLGANSKMYINGGDFVGSYGKLFVKNAGSIEIKGGKFFESTGSNKNDFNPENFGLVEGYLADTTINPGYYTVAKAYNVAKTIDATKVTVTGLNDAYACGGTVSFTVAANEGYNLTGVTLDGAALTADENGKYTFTMPERDVAIVVTTEAASTFDIMINGQPVANADALKLAAKAGTEMTVPATSAWTAEGNVLKKDGAAYVTFADYYTVVVNGTSVTLKLNKPVIGDSTEGADDAFTVTADAVTIKITNYNLALKYGVRSAADISGLSSAAITTVTPTAGVITLEKAAGNSAFYEVVVSDVPFAE